jgi:hypothetical protein
MLLGVWWACGFGSAELAGGRRMPVLSLQVVPLRYAAMGFPTALVPSGCHSVDMKLEESSTMMQRNSHYP